MSVVVMNEKVEKVEKVMKVKNMKLGVKYERMYMCLYTVLNRFCVSSSDDDISEDGFVLKKSDMRKILESVEFYNEDVVVQGEYMDANILSKENMKKVRKSMKQERMNMKKGVLEEEVVKKIRKSKKVKDFAVSSVSQEEVSGETVGTPIMKKSEKKSKKTEKTKNEEVDMEKIEIDVGKVVVVVESVVGIDLVEKDVGGINLVEKDVGGKDLEKDVGGKDLEKGVDVDVDVKGVKKVDVDVKGVDVDVDVKGVDVDVDVKGVKKVDKKVLKKPKKKSEMVEDIAL